MCLSRSDLSYRLITRKLRSVRDNALLSTSFPYLMPFITLYRYSLYFWENAFNCSILSLLIHSRATRRFVQLWSHEVPTGSAERRQRRRTDASWHDREGDTDTAPRKQRIFSASRRWLDLVDGTRDDATLIQHHVPNIPCILHYSQHENRADTPCLTDMDSTSSSLSSSSSW